MKYFYFPLFISLVITLPFDVICYQQITKQIFSSSMIILQIIKCKLLLIIHLVMGPIEKI